MLGARAWVLGTAVIVGCGGGSHELDAASVDTGPAVADTGLEEDARVETSLSDVVDAVLLPAIDGATTDRAQCVGAVAVIVTPGETLVRGYGATEQGGAQVPDARTLFQIGSITKIFTGLGLARLVVEGTVAPEASVGTLLAADLSSATDSWPTLASLISHHSGLPAFPDNLVDRDGDGRRDVGLDPRSPASGYAREHLRSALEGWSALPDEPYLYSNFGVGLAGLAMQDRLALPSHHALLQRLVTSDLGMMETWGEVDAIDADALPRLAEGQAVDGSMRVPGIPGRMGVLASSGEIVTTGNDMALFLGAMIGTRSTPLEPAIVLATTPLAPGPSGREMGYAIEIEHGAEGDILRKGGNTSSYSAYVMWTRAAPLGVVVMTSCGGFMPVVALTEQLFSEVRAAR